jgi:hypothetical protein
VSYIRAERRAHIEGDVVGAASRVELQAKLFGADVGVADEVGPILARTVRGESPRGSLSREVELDSVASV